MDGFDHITELNQYTQKQKSWFWSLALIPLSEKGNQSSHHFDMKGTIRKSSLSCLSILSPTLEETCCSPLITKGLYI